MALGIGGHVGADGVGVGGGSVGGVRVKGFGWGIWSKVVPKLLVVPKIVVPERYV